MFYPDTSDAERALLISEARFRAAVQAVRGIMWTRDCHGQMVGPQPGWEGLTGQSTEDCQGYGWRKAIHPEDIEHTVLAWETSIRDVKPFEITHRLKTQDGSYRHFRVRAVPVRDCTNTVVEWVGVHTDITSELAANEAIKESAHRYRTKFECASVMAWINSPEGECVMMNRAFRVFTGRSLPEFQFQDAVHPDDDAVRKKARNNIAVGFPYEMDYRILSAKGEYRWVHMAVSPLFDRDGCIYAWIGNGIDIDDYVSAQAKIVQELDVKRLLMDELNHRVRNTLAIIQAMVRQTLKNSATPKEFQKVFEARLHGLSLTHDILVAVAWNGAGLMDVVRAELRPICEGRWSMNGADIRLSAPQTTAIGMLLHELATNAVKHGSLTVGAGHVEVSWFLDGNRLRLYWRERGGPAAQEPTKPGFGTRLIEQIAGQLLGIIDPVYDSMGLHVCLDIPHIV